MLAGTKTLLPVWAMSLLNVLARVRPTCTARARISAAVSTPSTRARVKVTTAARAINAATAGTGASRTLTSAKKQMCQKTGGRRIPLDNGCQATHTHTIPEEGNEASGIDAPETHCFLLRLPELIAHQRLRNVMRSRHGSKLWSRTRLQFAILRGSYSPFNIWNVACYWTKLSVACIRID